ncbi:serine hydrolase domain-containing protein [Limibacter armeniacum]|uniref:serine hydrolase domain-containing protein n=1 Tax=Limibacter armeniacum TaxID=466084 RepID=UPI002FE52846
MKHYYFLLLLSFGTLSCQKSPQQQTMGESVKEETLEETLNGLQKQYDILGMSALAIKDGKEVFSYYNGMADVERQQPVTAKTKYRVASISKYVVTTGLMKLYEEGKFDLDTDVSKYLGFELRNPKHPAEVITIKHILTHSSGLSDSDAYFDFLMDTYKERNPSIEEVFKKEGKYYSDSTWSDNKPGVHFEYSNLGFGVIGNLIEKLSGERFDIYLRDHILRPLEISGSFNVNDLPDINELSVLYRREDLDPKKKWEPQTDNHKGEKPNAREDLKDYKAGWNGVAFGPQGSFRASAEELSKIMQLHMNKGTYKGKEILKPETVELMNSIHFKTDGDKVFEMVGLCAHIEDELLPDYRLFGHTGDAYGLHSLMFFNKEHNFGIVYIVNSSLVAEGKTGLYTVEEDLTRAIFEKLKPTLVDGDM